MSFDETKVTENTETVPAANTEVSESKPSETIGDNTASSDSAAATGDGQVASAYTPNYKYKVTDQEKELEEWVRPFIKDPDTEKKFKDIFTQVDAFGFQKQKREAAESRLESLAKDFQDQNEWVKSTIQLKDKDLDQFFARVRLSDEQIMKHVLAKLERQEALKSLPPELRQAYNDAAPLRNRVAELEAQLAEGQTMHQQREIQSRATELDNTLSSPEVAALAAEYDARAGAPGSFRKLVIRHGSAEFAESEGKRDLAAAEAVNEVLTLLGLKQATQGASQAPKPNESASTTPKVVVPSKTAVIPNVGSGVATSPTGKKPKSIDDIRAMAKAMQEAG